MFSFIDGQQQQDHHCLPHVHIGTTCLGNDSHLALAQGSLERLDQVCQTFLHNIDWVLQSLQPLDHPWQQEPASLKNLLLVMVNGQHRRPSWVGKWTHLS